MFPRPRTLERGATAGIAAATTAPVRNTPGRRAVEAESAPGASAAACCSTAFEMSPLLEPNEDEDMETVAIDAAWTPPETPVIAGRSVCIELTRPVVGAIDDSDPGVAGPAALKFGRCSAARAAAASVEVRLVS